MRHDNALPRALAAHGCAVVPKVLSELEVVGLTARLESAPVARSRAGARHLLAVPEVTSLAHDPRLIDLAASALGCAPVPFGATLFDKSANSNWLVVWHQDTALPIRARREVHGWGPWSVKNGVIYAHAPTSALNLVVALRIHFDDSNLDNGPLRVLPGTHTLGVLTDAEIHDLAARIEPFSCVVPRGGVLVLRPLTVHASSKVNCARSRRVLHLEYAASRHFEDGLELCAA
jgi:hypothetical protein